MGFDDEEGQGGGKKRIFYSIYWSMLAAWAIAVVPYPKMRQYFWLGFLLDPMALLMALTIASSFKNQIQSLLKHFFGN
jgi:hypothetical protein